FTCAAFISRIAAIKKRDITRPRSRTAGKLCKIRARQTRSAAPFVSTYFAKSTADQHVLVGLNRQRKDIVLQVTELTSRNTGKFFICRIHKARTHGAIRKQARCSNPARSVHLREEATD